MHGLPRLEPLPHPSLTHVETRSFTSFDGTPITYHVVGAPQGKPVLIGNGIGADHTYFNQAIARFGSDHRFLAWEYRGTYGSGRPVRGYDALTIADHARDGQAFLAHEGSERCGGLGWSMGVQILLEMCRDATPFDALVLHNGVAGRPWDTLLGGARLRRVVPGVLRALQRIDGVAASVVATAVMQPSLVQAAIGLRLAHKSLDRDAFSGLARRFRELDLHVLFEMLQRMGEHDASDVLPHIRCPTLVIAGTADKLTPVAAAEHMARAIPHAELVLLPGGSHYAALKMPDRMNTSLGTFWRGAEPALRPRAADRPARAV